jgi:hypothetical protein
MKQNKIKISEGDIKVLCREYLKIMGWFIFPILQGLGAYKGITDFIAIKDGRTLYIETKSPTGKQSGEQKIFQQEIGMQKGEYWLIDCWEDIIKMVGGK